MSVNRTQLILGHRATRSPGVVACLFSTIAVLTIPGCEQRGIEQTLVPNATERLPEPPAATWATGDGPSPGQATPEWPWSLPRGWEPDPEPRPMRLATYRVADEAGDIEVAASRFAGRVGGELANINRWRGQLGLPPIGEAELESALSRFETPGFEGYQARIESQDAVMLAAGVYEAAADQTWFVRATVADADAADRIEDDLFSMARSIAGPGGGSGD